MIADWDGNAPGGESEFVSQASMRACGEEEEIGYFTKASSFPPVVAGTRIPTPQELCAGLRTSGLSSDALVQIIVSYYGAISGRVPADTPAVSSVSTASVRSRQSARADAHFQALDSLALQEGYCYLWLVRGVCRSAVAERIGPCPTISRLFTDVEPHELAERRWDQLYVEEIAGDGYHISRDSGKGLPTFSQVIAGMVKVFARAVPAAWAAAAAKDEPVETAINYGSVIGVPRSRLSSDAWLRSSVVETAENMASDWKKPTGQFLDMLANWTAIRGPVQVVLEREVPIDALVLCVSNADVQEYRQRHPAQAVIAREHLVQGELRDVCLYPAVGVASAEFVYDLQFSNIGKLYYCMREHMDPISQLAAFQDLYRDRLLQRDQVSDGHYARRRKWLRNGDTPLSSRVVEAELDSLLHEAADELGMESGPLRSAVQRHVDKRGAFTQVQDLVDLPRDTVVVCYMQEDYDSLCGVDLPVVMYWEKIEPDREVCVYRRVGAPNLSRATLYGALSIPCRRLFYLSVTGVRDILQCLVNIENKYVEVGSVGVSGTGIGSTILQTMVTR
jgi:hypothetical protein